MVGTDRVAGAADVRNTITRADELGAPESEKVAELGVRTVVNSPVGFHGNNFAVLPRSVFQVYKEWRPLTGVSNLLEIVEIQETGLARGHGCNAHQRFISGAEFITEGAAYTRELGQDQLFTRLKSKTGANHEGMNVQTDTLGHNGQAAFLVIISRSDIRLNGQVGLAADKTIFNGHNNICFFHQRSCILALFDSLLVVYVGRTGVNLNSVGFHGSGSAHVSREHLQLNLDLLHSSLGVCFRVRTDDGNGVAELEDLFITQDGPVPAIALVAREIQAVDAVIAFDVLICDNLVDTGHFFRFRGVNGKNISM